MPIINGKVEDPCQECRDRHLKCDDNRPKCKQCERLGEKCQRGKGKIKFRHGSSAKYDTSFSKDQTWLEQSRKTKIQFVDQGPELENIYAQDDNDSIVTHQNVPEAKADDNNDYEVTEDNTSPTRSQITIQDIASSVDSIGPSPSIANTIDTVHSPAKRRKTNETTSPSSAITERTDQWVSPRYDPVRFSYRIYEPPRTASPYQWEGVSFVTEQNNVPKVVEAEYRRLADSAAAAIPPEFLLSPAIWKEEFYWPNKYTTTQCAVLMRYYIEHLAPWFDVGDPARHFTHIVPQRARRCPPLLNAIFTAASRHLASLSQYRTHDGIIQYEGVLLPNLTPETALQYHNACIAYLIKLSADPEHVQDENLLAAAVILRYYEELDTSFTGQDTETFLHTFQIFVNAQVNGDFVPPLASDETDFGLRQISSGLRQSAIAYLKSFQHASSRIALRQETTMAFLKQRSIRLPLETWSVLEGFGEAEDFIWADRQLYHCAKVLQFCFGGEARSKNNQIDRWNELKDFERQWEQNKPLSFSPIHYQEPNYSLGQSFPQIWYMAEIHVSGLQYLDLARILLTFYNPNIPRLGPGATAAQRRLSDDIRSIVTRVCGVATSNKGSQPAMVQAYMAIAICGEHFNDPVEHKALLNILMDLETLLGWPTSKTLSDLKFEWGLS